MAAPHPLQPSSLPALDAKRRAFADAGCVHKRNGHRLDRGRQGIRGELEHSGVGR